MSDPAPLVCPTPPNTSSPLEDATVQKIRLNAQILHLPTSTPQLNPLGAEWWEIKAAIPDIFFDGLEKMRAAIRRMIRSGEMPI